MPTRPNLLHAPAVLAAAALIIGALAFLTPAPKAEAALPLLAPEMGLTTGCCTPAGVTLADQVDGYAATGAGWVRTGFDWRSMEPAKGSYAWSRDGIVSAFRATGMKVLGVVAYSPSWATDPACDAAYGGKCPPRDPADFARFAAALAERYDADGKSDAPGSPRVDAWELWNEPNLANFWRPTPNPAAYAALLRAAAPAIRKAAPKATIVSAGLSPAGGTFAPVEFLRSLYANRAADTFDALGFHPYSYPALPSKVASWNAWQQMFQTFPSVGATDSLRSLMIANGDGAKLVWATEYGAPTGGDTNGDGVSNCDADGITVTGEDRCLTPARQAAMVTEAYTLWRAYPWAGPMFWYSYQDLDTGDASIEDNFGLIRTDGTPKPAYDAFRTLALTAG